MSALKQNEIKDCLLDATQEADTSRYIKLLGLERLLKARTSSDRPTYTRKATAFYKSIRNVAFALSMQYQSVSKLEAKIQAEEHFANSRIDDTIQLYGFNLWNSNKSSFSTKIDDDYHRHLVYDEESGRITIRTYVYCLTIQLSCRNMRVFQSSPSIRSGFAPSYSTMPQTNAVKPILVAGKNSNALRSRSLHITGSSLEQSSREKTRQFLLPTYLHPLRCTVTTELLTFLFLSHPMPLQEAAFLQRLRALWCYGETLFRSELSTHYDPVSQTLTAWLDERQAIAALRHSMATNPGVSHIGIVDRLLAMNDLRAMRLKWKNMSSIYGMNPEDLLCMAFKVVTNTEVSEHLYKNGLAQLELSVPEFLRIEGSKIVIKRGKTKVV